MTKKLIAVALIMVTMITMLTGCFGGSYYIEDLKFNVDGAVFHLGQPLSELLACSAIEVVDEIDVTSDLASMRTKKIKLNICTRAGENEFSVTVWNNTKSPIKLNDAIIKEVAMASNDLDTPAALSFMDLRMTDDLATFANVLGPEYTTSAAMSNNILTWSAQNVTMTKYKFTFSITNGAHGISKMSMSIE